jgi:hypothetical protein
MNQQELNLQEDRTIRTSPSTAIIFSILFLPALFVGFQCIFKTGQLCEGLLFFVLYSATIFAICSPTVLIANNTLTYRNFFGSRSIDISSVIKISVTAEPAPTLNIFTPDIVKPFSFIIKPFSKNGVTCIMKSIRMSAPSASFDAISDDLSNSDFSSLTRETLKTQNIVRLILLVGSVSIAAALSRALFH